MRVVVSILGVYEAEDIGLPFELLRVAGPLGAIGKPPVGALEGSGDGFDAVLALVDLEDGLGCAVVDLEFASCLAD